MPPPYFKRPPGGMLRPQGTPSNSLGGYGSSGGGMPRDEARILRDRVAEQERSWSRDARPNPPASNARIALKVIDGGSMPTAPDHYFLGKISAFDGAESEGGPWSAVDDDTIVPFVALHNAPKVDDRVVATAVGGRWVAELGNGTSYLCVKACTNVSVVGAVVTVLSIPDNKVVGTCTVPETACCKFNLIGTYRVRVSLYGAIAYDGNRTLSPVTPSVILLNAGSGFVCCNNHLIPTHLKLTDASGSTIDFIFNPNWYYPMWTGGHVVSKLSAPVTMPTGLCEVGDASNGPVRICYQMICRSGKTPQFAVQRSWSWVYRKGDFTPIWYQDDTGFVPGQFCATAPPPLCGNPLTDVATADVDPDSYSPFALTANPAPAPGNATADPVGGSVAISE